MTEKMSTEPQLNELGKEALEDLKLTLEALKIPDNEQQDFVNLLLLKINGATDEDLIDMSLANILQLAQKRGKEIKSSSKEKTSEKEGSCSKCGAVTKSGQNFCTNCGNKLEVSCAKCGAITAPGQNFCTQCGDKL
jgi:RNA polymerase subunit RPABC4/transcription elongation factor Spt4